MEALVSGEKGISGMLAGLIVMLALHLIIKCASFAVELLKKKNELTEKSIDNLKNSIENLVNMIGTNVSATHQLEERMRSVETQLSEISKFKVDIRMLFSAIKMISGDKWPDLKKSIMDDTFI